MVLENRPEQRKVVGQSYLSSSISGGELWGGRDCSIASDELVGWTLAQVTLLPHHDGLTLVTVLGTVNQVPIQSLK